MAAPWLPVLGRAWLPKWRQAALTKQSGVGMRISRSGRSVFGGPGGATTAVA